MLIMYGAGSKCTGGPKMNEKPKNYVSKPQPLGNNAFMGFSIPKITVLGPKIFKTGHKNNFKLGKW